MKNKTAVVLGASNKPERYSHMAIKLLKEHGYKVIPVHPRYEQIEGLPVSHALTDIHEPVDILTIYVNPLQILQYTEQIIQLRPGLTIFNPGTECEALAEGLRKHQIKYIMGCTLVMLRTGQLSD